MRILFLYKYLNLENNIFKIYYYNSLLYVKISIFTHVIFDNFELFIKIFINLATNLLRQHNKSSVFI